MLYIAGVGMQHYRGDGIAPSEHIRGVPVEDHQVCLGAYLDYADVVAAQGATALPGS